MNGHSIAEVMENLEKQHSRNVEFTNMVDLLMRIGSGMNIQQSEASIMEASCEVRKGNLRYCYYNTCCHRGVMMVDTNL
jgi:hypothetical protein